MTVEIRRNGIPGPGSDVLQPLADAAAGSAALSQDWAEGTEPGGAGTKSSKEWAEQSQADGAAQTALATEQASLAFSYKVGAVDAANRINVGFINDAEPVNGGELGAIGVFGNPSPTSAADSVVPATWAGWSWRSREDGSFLALRTVDTLVGRGDSIGANVAASPTTQGWLTLLGADLLGTLTNSSVPGSGVQSGSGLTTPLRTTFETELLGGTTRKTMAILPIGFNDGRVTSFGSAANFKTEYGQMLARLLRTDGYSYYNLVLGEPYYITDAGLATPPAGSSTQSRAVFEQYVTAVQELAREWGLPLIPFYSWLAANPTELAAFIADVNGNDSIHPKNPGHAILRTIAKEQTYIANTMARPQNAVFVTSSSGTFTVNFDRIPGAVSYQLEYGEASNYNFTTGSASVPQSSSTPISYTVTPSPDKTYAVRVRAVFAGSIYGPWALVAGLAYVTGSLVSTATGREDSTSLAGASSTAITARSPALGAWTKNASSTVTQLSLDGSARIRGSTLSNAYATYYLSNDAIPTGGRVYAEANIRDGGGWTAGGVLAGVFARCDTALRRGLFLLYNGINIRLFHVNGTTFTTLGTYNGLPEDILNFDLRLECGSSLQLGFLNDEPIISTAFSDAYLNGLGTLGTTQGIHVNGTVNYTVGTNGPRWTFVETGTMA